MFLFTIVNKNGIMRAFVILCKGLGFGADTLQIYVGKNEIKTQPKE